MKVIRVFDGLPLTISRREVYRYMGMGAEATLTDGQNGARSIAALDEVVAVVCAQLLAQCRMKAVSRRMTVQLVDGTGDADEADVAAQACTAMAGQRLCFDGQMMVCSEKLARNLQHCREVFLFGATLGPEADRLISRESRRDMSRGLACEAAATALIEAYCDACQSALATEIAAEGKTLRPRFSPGYGDLSIACQPEILRLLDGPRRIGLTLTEGLMLAPTKSVTAFMGIADKNETIAEPPTGCAACTKVECQYRRKG